MHRTIIEPFRIKMVEPIQMTTLIEREVFMKKAHYNPFLLNSDQVIIDLLTDSGTSAMSSGQWSALMNGDESYAGARSWHRMYNEIHDLTGYDQILPTHQGRAAEKILYTIIGGKGKVFVSNAHFDTTRANIEYSGAIAIDCQTPEYLDSNSSYPFKGNIDIDLLEKNIIEHGATNIGAVILTVTNNTGGGQPVSFKNAVDTSIICKKYGVLFILDACRIAENSYFIKNYETDQKHKSYRQIAKDMFALADGCIMSAKKDAMVNMGGFLALNNVSLAEECTQLLIITEGFSTYGGLSGRDMETIATGLQEVFEPDYLEYRIKSTQYLGNGLQQLGVPIQLPVGGHAVYINAGELYKHLPPSQYPGQSLVIDMYVKGGIRACEIGSVMFGKLDAQNQLIPASKELVRLAIPRRVYTQSHIDYVIETFEMIVKNKHQAKGIKIIKEPKFLRHFTSHFDYIS